VGLGQRIKHGSYVLPAEERRRVRGRRREGADRTKQERYANGELALTFLSSG